jgi:hypothetical protein
MTTTYELHISAHVDGEERILFGGRIHYSREDAEREADKIYQTNKASHAAACRYTISKFIDHIHWIESTIYRPRKAS